MVRCARFVALLCVLAVAIPAAAQVQTGSILVRATDAQGAMVPGATVTISSAVLAGSAVGVTDAGGVYRFPSLAPGTFSRVLIVGSSAHDLTARRSAAP